MIIDADGLLRWRQPSVPMAIDGAVRMALRAIEFAVLVRIAGEPCGESMSLRTHAGINRIEICQSMSDHVLTRLMSAISATELIGDSVADMTPPTPSSVP
ncbi:MAG: hypothetical protein FWF28_01100 [Micrococcales bacterium]|nr:hypothetical protein [Micrococcales bacterium]